MSGFFGKWSKPKSAEERMDLNPQYDGAEPDDTTGANPVDDTQQNGNALFASPATPGSDAQDPTAAGQEFHAILEQLASLQESFDSKWLFDKKKDEQITFLHDEIKQGQDRLFQQILRSLYLSLVKLYDLIGDGRTGALNDADDVAKVASLAPRNYEAYQTEVEEILMRYGVNTYTTKQGEPFDRSRHMARETIDFADPSRDNTIAESQRPGFLYAGTVLRPEWVKVYRSSVGSQS